MRLLTQEEISVARKIKHHGFGAYLQAEWFKYERLMECFLAGQNLKKVDLEDINSRMDEFCIAFWYRYENQLPRISMDVLVLERIAWRLLSVRIERHINNFDKYLQTYSSEACKRDELLAHLENWWSLLQMWNTISRSYKCKLEEMRDELEERENDLRKLIEQLSQSAE